VDKTAQESYSAGEMLDRYFLQVRSHLLETAATLDRVDRATGAEKTAGDPRREFIARSLKILADGRPWRARRILELYSKI
jgi:hypothetical protein